MFTVRWKFKNDHMWEKSFDTPELRDSFINSVGLVSHPDIVRITLLYPDSTIKSIVIKDTASTTAINREGNDREGIAREGDNMSKTSIYA